MQIKTGTSENERPAAHGGTNSGQERAAANRRNREQGPQRGQMEPGAGNNAQE